MGSADALARRRTHHARRHALARSQGTKPALADWLTARAPNPLSPSLSLPLPHVSSSILNCYNFHDAASATRAIATRRRRRSGRRVGLKSDTLKHSNLSPRKMLVEVPMNFVPYFQNERHRSIKSPESDYDSHDYVSNRSRFHS